MHNMRFKLIFPLFLQNRLEDLARFSRFRLETKFSRDKISRDKIVSRFMISRQNISRCVSNAEHYLVAAPLKHEKQVFLMLLAAFTVGIDGESIATSLFPYIHGFAEVLPYKASKITFD